MKKMLMVMALALAGTASADGAAKVYTGVAAAPSQPADQEIAKLFDRWNAALATGDADKVTALYAPQAILQPTVSNQVRATSGEIKDYFVKFLKAKPQGTINYREIRRLDSDTALDAGVYTFALVKDGKPTQVQARYSYLYEKINGDWKIINHHSSAMPEPIDPAQLVSR